MENLSRFYESLKSILSRKKTKITLYIAAVLWLAVATQLFMNRFFYEEAKLTQAFVNTNSGDLRSSIEMIADYQKDFLSEEDKKQLIYYLANAIGLKIDQKIAVSREEGRSEYSYEKQAKHATTILKVISLEQKKEEEVKMKHYIMVKLRIKDSIHSMDRYRKLLEEALTKLGVEKKQLTLQYEGSFSGMLTSAEKDRISELMVKELDGEVAMSYEEDGLYTVYAYTGLINEYIMSMGSKVNIQIAIAYDEEAGKTMVYLASPILNTSW